MRFYSIIGNIGLVKTPGLINKKQRSMYILDSDIRKEMDSGNISKALLLSCSAAESYLRYLYIKEKEKDKIRTFVSDLEKYRRKNLVEIIKFLKGKKIINNKEARVLNFLREVRNDLSHNYQLIYDQNLSKKKCNEIIAEKAIPIIDTLHRKSMESQVR